MEELPVGVLAPERETLGLSEADKDLLFRDAHTAYTFSEEPVSDEQLREIYDLMKYGPTASNFTPLRMLYVQSPEARAKLVPLMSAGNQAKTATAPAVAILAADTNFHEYLPNLVPHRPDLQKNFADPERREKLATTNALIEAGYFILAVRAAGLAAGPMGGLDAAAIDRTFFAGTGWKTLIAVNIGKPGIDAFRPRAPRLDFEEAAAII